jgi:hypothetical protein
VSTTTTRADHLAWCKTRALEYVEAGDLDSAFSSLASDLNKHPETKDHAAIQLGALLEFGGHLNTPKKMRDFIEGCN